MTTDHGPQRESIRDLMGRHGLDPNRMQSERDFIDMMQPYAEDLMTTDHGPQRQPDSRVSDMADGLSELARLRAENERLLRGDFTEEEFQNLCHKFDESDAERFAVGCRLYWEKLFGKDKAAVCAAVATEQHMLAQEQTIAELTAKLKKTKVDAKRRRTEVCRLRSGLKLFANPDNWVKDAMEDDWYWDGEGKPWQLAADALRGEE